MASSKSTSSASISSISSSSRDGTAKATVADHISQAVQSTSNLLHLMQQSSPSQACLMKLPKNLVAKTSTIRNTAQVLEQLPQVISSLDAHTEDGLHRLNRVFRDDQDWCYGMQRGLRAEKGSRDKLEISIRLLGGEHPLSVPHLKTVIQLLSNMESSQLSPAFHPNKNQEVQIILLS
ncbi:hypothetical protein IFM89_027673 [Coptis chinensis]|uniref:Tobamovirus multiplication protein 2B n=1 Tax=Coptis chinensis TaxID=261450 RepID=A0A835IYS1_9MAGN|nr:hypothetical protein IFM89_027673 [Coptis chinensis]